MENSKIYITNLGRYNEGSLIGKWVNLPITEDDFKQQLTSIDVDGVQYEEWFITDWENMPEIMDEYTTDINVLNEYADLMEAVNNRIDNLENEISDSDYRFIKSELTSNEFLKNHDDDIQKAINAIEDVLIFTVDCNDIVSDVYVEYAYYYLEMDEHFLNLPEHLKGYFDIKKYGRDMALDSYRITDNASENYGTPTVILEFLD